MNAPSPGVVILLAVVKQLWTYCQLLSSYAFAHSLIVIPLISTLELDKETLGTLKIRVLCLLAAFWILNASEQPLRKLLALATSKVGSVCFLSLYSFLIFIAYSRGANLNQKCLMWSAGVTFLIQVYRGFTPAENQVLKNAAPRASRKLLTQNRV
jgi:hypothetical protein